MRDATELKLGVEEWMEFLLTRPLRDATHVLADDISYNRISTHAPHAGRDICRKRSEAGKTDFYSRAPCGTRPPHALKYIPYIISTHAPHAGRDTVCPSACNLGTNFYSRAPCGTRREIKILENLHKDFYSRAPCGTRLLHCQLNANSIDFYSRAPCGTRLNNFPNGHRE